MDAVTGENESMIAIKVLLWANNDFEVGISKRVESSCRQGKLPLLLFLLVMRDWTYLRARSSLVPPLGSSRVL